MSWKAGWINRKICEIDKQILDTHLDRQKVFATVGEFTEESMDELVNRIAKRQALMKTASILVGEIDYMTLPSGELVSAREDWVQKKEKLHNSCDALERAQESDIYWLRHRDEMQKHGQAGEYDG